MDNIVKVKGCLEENETGKGFSVHISRKSLSEIYHKTLLEPDDAMITLEFFSGHTGLHEETKRKVANILLKFGVPSNIKGYRYLIEAIVLELNEKNIKESKYGYIYQHIAKQFKSTASGVERSIRRAIELTWNYGDMDELNEFFGNHFCYYRDKPSNSEFISKFSEISKIKGLIW